MSAGKKPSFDYGTCMACGACLPACPFDCIDLSKLGVDRWKKAYPELARPVTCTGCGLCARACPVDCIELLAAGEVR
jgi:electron transport complex protein RnfB